MHKTKINNELIDTDSYKDVAKLLSPLRAKSRTQEVLEALVGMIAEAGLEIGDQLPGETVLSEQLGVGRSTIREALNRWEGLGLVKRRRGSGTYLTANIRPARGLVSTETTLESEGLLRIVDVRRTLEVEVVRRAAINATEAQKQRILSGFEKLKTVVASGMMWRNVDQAFHTEIYEASGNAIFGRIILDLDDAYHAAKFRDSPFDNPEFGVRSVLAHGDLCNAIVAGDAEAAVRAISIILDHVVDEIREMSETDK
ncbi:MAG: FadR family transcriptional regulator [Rhizobiales bacterium]|nr:FadR family transcriptional regulator [Hyphomicrobiales bacterium]